MKGSRPSAAAWRDPPNTASLRPSGPSPVESTRGTARVAKNHVSVGEHQHSITRYALGEIGPPPSVSGRR